MLSSSARRMVFASALALAPEVDAQSFTVQPGDEGTLDYAIHNAADSLGAVEGVVMTVDTGAVIHIVSSSPLTATTLPPDGSVNFSFSYSVPADAPGGPAVVRLMPAASTVNLLPPMAGLRADIPFSVTPEPIRAFDQLDAAQPLMDALFPGAPWLRAEKLKFLLWSPDGVSRFELLRGPGPVFDLAFSTDMADFPRNATVRVPQSILVDSRDFYIARLSEGVNGVVDRYFLLDRNPPRIDIQTVAFDPAAADIATLTGAALDDGSGIASFVRLQNPGPGDGPAPYAGPSYPPGPASTAISEANLATGRYYYLARDRSSLAPAVGGTLLDAQTAVEGGYCAKPPPSADAPFYPGNGGHLLESVFLNLSYGFTDSSLQTAFDQGRLGFPGGGDPSDIGTASVYLRSRSPSATPPLPGAWSVQSTVVETPDQLVLAAAARGGHTAPAALALAPVVESSIRITSNTTPVDAVLTTYDAGGAPVQTPIVIPPGGVHPVTAPQPTCSMRSASVTGFDEDAAQSIPVQPATDAEISIDGVSLRVPAFTTPGSVMVARVPFEPPPGFFRTSPVRDILLTAGYNPPLSISIPHESSLPADLLAKETMWHFSNGTLSRLNALVDARGAVGETPSTSLFFLAIHDALAPRTTVQFSGPTAPGAAVPVIAASARVEFLAVDGTDGESVDTGVEGTYYLVDEVLVDSTTTPPLRYTGPFGLPEGRHTLSFTSVDRVGNTENPLSVTIDVDGTAPKTTLSVAGSSQPWGPGMILSSGTRVTLSASDPLSNGVAAGTAAVVAFIDTDPASCGLAPGALPVTVATAPFGSCANPVYSVPFTLSEGTHSLVYFSADRVFNLEESRTLVVAVDASAPETTLALSTPSGPLPGGTLETDSTVFVILTATDPVRAGTNSGILATFAYLDASCGFPPAFPLNVVSTAPMGSCGNPVYSGPFTLTAGTHTLTFFTVDDVLNTETPQIRQFVVRLAAGSDPVPPAPASPPFPTVAMNSMTVAWSGAANPLGTLYRVELSSTPTFTSILASSATYATYAPFTGLSTNTRYHARAASFVPSLSSWGSFTYLGSTSTLIETPSEVVFDEVGVDRILASAYAPNPAFTNLGVGLSGTDAAVDGAWAGWHGEGWTSRAPMPTGRWGPAAEAVSGRVFVFGGYGSSVLAVNEAYDPANDAWAARAPMKTARYTLGSAALGGHIFAVGGASATDNLTVNEEYDPVVDTWTSRANMTVKRAIAASGGIEDLSVFIMSGGGQDYSQTHVYDAKTDSWHVGASMPTPRTYVFGAVLGRELYAMGGSNGPLQDAVESYDPVADRWTTHARLPQARGGSAARGVGGKVLVAAGSGGSGFLLPVLAYDPRTDTWAPRAPIPTPRNYPAVASLGGVLYFAGGIERPQAFEAYDPGVAREFTGLSPNRQYAVSVRARNADGVATAAVAASTWTRAAVPGPAPFGGVFGSSVVVRWTAGGNPAGTEYRAEASSSNWTGDRPTSAWTAALEAPLAGLTPNATWFFRVQARNGAGIPTAYAVVGSTVLRPVPAEPPSPAALSFPMVGVSSLTAAWGPASNPLETLYLAQLSSAADFSRAVRSVETRTLGASFTGLAANTLYHARAAAYDPASSTWTAFTALGSALTLAQIPLAAAAAFPMVGVSSLSVAWATTANPPGTSYLAQLSTAADFSGVIFSSQTCALAAAFTGLSAGTRYHARAATYEIASGTWTAFVTLGSAETLAEPPTAVAVPFPGVGTDFLTAAWGPASNGPGVLYLAQLSTSADFSGSVLSSATYGLSASFIGLRPNTRYHARAAVYQTSLASWSGFTVLGSTATFIEAPVEVVFDEVGVDRVIASAYAPNPAFTDLGKGLSGTNAAVDGAWAGWHGEAWSTKAALTTGRWGPAAEAVEGRVFVFGGYGSGVLAVNEAYDPGGDSWSPRAPMPTARYTLGSAALGGHIFAVGGASAADNLTVNEEYDPIADAWTNRAQMSVKRAIAASGGIEDLSVFIMSGGGVDYNQTHVYDARTDSWHVGAPMPTPRTYVFGAVLGGELYAMGGSNGPLQDAVESYDPAADRWTGHARLPEARGGSAARAVGGKILVAAGATTTNARPPTLAYDPRADLWTAHPAMPAARSYPAAAALAGVLYFAGGIEDPQAFEAYDPGVAREFAGLTPNTLHSFSVKARNADGVETGAVTASTWTRAAVPGSAPLAAVFASSAVVRWAANGNPAGTEYRVEASSSGWTGAALSSPWTATLESTMAGLTPYATWFFRVQARNAVGIPTPYLVLGSTVPRLFQDLGQVTLASDGVAAFETPVPAEILVVPVAQAPSVYTLSAQSLGLEAVTGSFYNLTDGLVFPAGDPAVLSFLFDPSLYPPLELAVYTFRNGGWTTDGIANQRYEILGPNLAVFSADLVHTSDYTLMHRTRPLDVTPPAVAFGFPRPDEPGLCRLAQGRVTVRGNVSDENMASWRLEEGGVLLGSGTANAAGTLGFWDAGGKSGAFTLALSARDSSANAASVSLAVQAGSPLRTLALGGEKRLNKPRGVAVGPNRIYVADTNGGAVRVFDLLGNLITSFGSAKGAGKLNKPSGVALDTAGNVLVADSANKRVARYSAAGTYLAEVGKGQLERPMAVAALPGKILVADAKAGQVVVFSDAGALLSRVALPPAVRGREEGDDEEEPRPTALAVDAAGNLWVADAKGGRVLRYDAGLALAQTIAGFERPEGVAVSPSGACLAVVDSKVGRVRTFDAALGAELAAFGKENLHKPAQAVFTPDGQLFVADRNDDMVTGFGLPGTPVVLALAKPGKSGGARLSSADSSAVEEPVVARVGALEGGAVEQGDGTKVEVPAGAVSADQDVSVAKAADSGDDYRVREAARGASGLAAASSAREFGPHGLTFREPALITLPYDPALVASARDLKVHYWNAERGVWEALDSVVDEAAHTVSARVAHFSLYQVLAPARSVAVMADPEATFGLRQVYAFPNPAVGGQKPTVHVAVGRADKVTVRIYDIAGSPVHEATIDAPSVVNDETGAHLAYEHTWDGHIPSGVYIYTVTAEKAGNAPIKRVGKLAVVR